MIVILSWCATHLWGLCTDKTEGNEQEKAVLRSGDLIRHLCSLPLLSFETTDLTNMHKFSTPGLAELGEEEEVGACSAAPMRMVCTSRTCALSPALCLLHTSDNNAID